MQIQLTRLGKITIVVFLGLITGWFMHYLSEYKGVKFSLELYFLYVIAAGGFFISLKGAIIFIWGVIIKPAIRWHERKNIKRIIRQLEDTKETIQYKRKELVKTIEQKLEENPTEEKQKEYMDLYFKLRDFFDSTEESCNVRIEFYTMKLYFF